MRGYNTGITDGEEMGSAAITYISSFIKIVSGIQKLIAGVIGTQARTHTQTAR
jgi:hypothetical protein